MLFRLGTLQNRGKRCLCLSVVPHFTKTQPGTSRTLQTKLVLCNLNKASPETEELKRWQLWKSSKYKYIFCKDITEISRWGHVSFPWSCPLLLWLPSAEGCLSAGQLLSQDTAGQFPAPPQAATPHRGCGGARVHLHWLLIRDEAQSWQQQQLLGGFWHF